MDGDVRSLAGVCGQYCGVCESHDANECRGCAYELGLTRHGECAIFQCCVGERGLEHCGLCEKFPCQLFLSSEPDVGGRRRRVELEHRLEKGTDQWLALAECEARNVKHGDSKSEAE